MAQLTPFEVISHTRRVCSLYKKCLRTAQDWTPDRAEYRFRSAIVRAEFDQRRDVKDFAEAVRLVEMGEAQQQQSRHYSPFKFPRSPGGIDYGRYPTVPDWVLDFWDPVEKAFFPEYFKLREFRKKQYVEMWVKKYGKPDPDSTTH